MGLVKNSLWQKEIFLNSALKHHIPHIIKQGSVSEHGKTISK